MNETIKKKIATYNKACNDLLLLWCDKHDYLYDNGAWVANQHGGAALIGDYYVDMETILTDLAEDAPEEEFLKWYDYCQDVAMLDLTTPNFKSWLHGCPRIPDERLQRLRKMRNEINGLIKQTKKEYKNGTEHIF